MTAAAAWPRWYWPAAVAAAVAALVALPRYEGWVILAGALALGGPECWFLARRQYASTLSDWTWRVLDVTRSQPVEQWKAQHFLALAAYLAVAVRVTGYLCGLGYWPGAAGAGLAAWLTWHLFGRWWR